MNITIKVEFEPAAHDTVNKLANAIETLSMPRLTKGMNEVASAILHVSQTGRTMNRIAKKTADQLINSEGTPEPSAEELDTELREEVEAQKEEAAKEQAAKKTKTAKGSPPAKKAKKVDSKTVADDKRQGSQRIDTTKVTNPVKDEEVTEEKVTDAAKLLIKMSNPSILRAVLNDTCGPDYKISTAPKESYPAMLKGLQEKILEIEATA